MKLTLCYRGQLATAAGIASEEIEVEPGTSALSIVQDAARRAGGEFEGMVFDADGQPLRTLLVAADGEQLVDLSVPVGEGVREITLMPPIAGG